MVWTKCHFVVFQEMNFCLQHTHTHNWWVGKPPAQTRLIDRRTWSQREEKNKPRFHQTYYDEGLAHEYLLSFMTFPQDAYLVLRKADVVTHLWILVRRHVGFFGNLSMNIPNFGLAIVEFLINSHANLGWLHNCCIMRWSSMLPVPRLLNMLVFMMFVG